MSGRNETPPTSTRENSSGAREGEAAGPRQDQPAGLAIRSSSLERLSQARAAPAGAKRSHDCVRRRLARTSRLVTDKALADTV